jgi:DNA-binding beta-propeller fold protein YncE
VPRLILWVPKIFRHPQASPATAGRTEHSRLRRLRGFSARSSARPSNPIVMMINVSHTENAIVDPLPPGPAGGRGARRKRAWRWLALACVVIAVAFVISVIEIHRFLYGSTIIVKVGASPGAVVVSPDGRTIYLAESNNSITPVSAATGKTGRPVPVRAGSLGTDLAIAPDGRMLFATTYGTSGNPLALACIDLRKEQETAAIQPPGGTAGFAISHDGMVLYVISEDGKLYAASAITCRTERRIPLTQDLPGGATATALAPDGTTLYVATSANDGGNYGGTVTPVDLRTGAVGRSISVGWQPASLAITPDGRTIYASVDGSDGPGVQAGSNHVTVIDAASGTVRATLPWQVPPDYLQMTPGGKTLWVVSTSGASGSTADSTVTPVDVTSDRPGASFRTSGWLNSQQDQPSGAAISPDGQTLYVTVASGLESFHISLASTFRARDLVA